MRSHSFQATGTDWWICCDLPQLLLRAEDLVREAEQSLSRFRPDSSLSRLNRERASSDPMLSEVVQAALRMWQLTGGVFDATLGARLEELGYDRSFDEIQTSRPADRNRAGSLAVALEPGRVRLEGRGNLDLGGIGKGWIVDRVAAMLAGQGSQAAVVDGGGDIRVVGGPWPIGYGAGHVVHLESEAIATSSRKRRRWRDANGRELHHILDPGTGDPAFAGIDTVTVRASEASLADALATAMLVDADRTVSVLESVGAHATARDEHGRWWTTPHWETTS